RLSDDTRFVIGTTGLSHLENVNLRVVDDNFDFTSNSGFLQVLNPFYRAAIDPYGLARQRIELEFRGQTPVVYNYYYESNYQADQAYWNNVYSLVPSPLTTAYTQFGDILTTLKNHKVVQYVRDDGVPIVYGTPGGDTITYNWVTQPSTTGGYIAAGGPGDDNI